MSVSLHFDVLASRCGLSVARFPGQRPDPRCQTLFHFSGVYVTNTKNMNAFFSEGMLSGKELPLA